MNKDHTKTQLSISAAQNIKESDYWQQKLAALPMGCHFPFDSFKPGRQTAVYRTLLAPDVAERLIRVGGGSDLRLHVILVALVAVLLDRCLLREDRDIIIGTSVYKQEEQKEGRYINTVLPLRIVISEGIDLKRFLGHVRQTVAEAVAHQNYPMEALLHRLGLDLDGADEGFPLFDVAVLLENVQSRAYLDHPTLGTIFCFNRSDRELELKLEYDARRFREATAARLVNIFTGLAGYLFAHLEQPLERADFISRQEKERLLGAFNRTARDYVAGKTVVDIFSEQVERNPDRPCVSGLPGYVEADGDPAAVETTTLTYAELNAKADAWARLLIEKGAGPGTVVGLRLERTLGMAAVIMGVIKAGAAYLPVAPDSPDRRLIQVWQDTAVVVGVCSTAPDVVPGFCEILVPDLLEDKLQKPAGGEVKNAVQATDPVYVIYTSGSSGTPKGVVIGHRNLHNLVVGLKERIYDDYDHPLQVGLVSPYIFDASVKQIFAALLLGHTLHIVPEAIRVDGAGLLDYLEDKGIEICDGTPTHLKLLLESGIEGRDRLRLKHLLIGGEALKKPLLEAFFAKFADPPRVTNVYGPSECTVDAAAFHITAGNLDTLEEIPIGTPMTNCRIYILDTRVEGHGLPQPLGIPGELCIAGHGVGAGYLNRPGLTARQFVAHPFEAGEVMYKTGDLALWQPDGNIRFLGRIDQQVKIRGYRLEPGEIEARLCEHEQVKGAVVVAKEVPPGCGEPSLCAYVAVENHRERLGDPSFYRDLRDFLALDLPDYMIPTYFIPLGQLPLTPSGKVERRLLPQPDPQAGGIDTTGPQNSTQEKLQDLWSNILNVETDKIGIDANFFQLGGHSLKATILVARVHREFGVKISLAKFFMGPTIRELAQLIDHSRPTLFEDLVLGEDKEHYPLSYNQKRLWFINRVQPESTAYTMAGTMEQDRPLDADVLTKVLARLIKRHESLRTGFKLLNGEPVQFILEDIKPDFKIVDFSDLAESDIKDEYRKIFRDSTFIPFDLTRPPLFRFVGVKFPRGRSAFMFCMHHIVSDGWSMEIFRQEFFRLYEGYLVGREVDLPPVTYRYRDFAEWQNKRFALPGVEEEACNYWQEKFAGGAAVLDMPVDFLDRKERSDGAAWQFMIDGEMKDRIYGLAKEANTTPFMVLFSCFLTLIARFAGQDDVLCSIINSGRDHDALHGITGFFVNSVLFQTRVDQGEAFVDFLHRLDGEVLEVFQHQHYPLEAVFQKLKMKYPEVPVSFNLLNMQDKTAGDELQGFAPYHLDRYPEVKFDLECYLIEFKNGFNVRWTYKSKAYKSSTIKYLIEEYLGIISYFTGHGHRDYRSYKQAQKKKRNLW